MHFGKPLVRSTENFGTSGKEPSHPELLDYLAHYLIEHDWSLKALHQHIMESSTYRMGHIFNESSAAIDPDNRWYWRHTPRRLEVEAIRDTLLSVSGELDRTIGGAPFEGIATLSPSPQALMANRRTYENSKRRSVYLPIVRTNVYKLLTLFDFPNPAFPTAIAKQPRCLHKPCFYRPGSLNWERLWPTVLLNQQRIRSNAST